MERLSFLGYQQMGNRWVASLDNGNPFVIDRANLEQRVANLKAGGYEYGVSQIVLDNWPEA